MVVAVQHGGHGGLLPAGEDGPVAGDTEDLVLIDPGLQSIGGVPAGEAVAGVGMWSP